MLLISSTAAQKNGLPTFGRPFRILGGMLLSKRKLVVALQQIQNRKRVLIRETKHGRRSLLPDLA